jgi:serpin B
MNAARLVAVLAVLAMLPTLAKGQDSDTAPAACGPGAGSADLSAEAQDAVKGVNAFSLDLYKRTLTAGANQFLSPASVSTAVALAYRGAVGQTADELRRVMHYTAAPAAYLRASGAVFATMNICGRSRILQAANAIWVQDGMPLKPDYAADVQAYMGAGLRRTDFRADPEKSVAEINAWVASATRDRITDLLHKDDVTDKTRATLGNAIYWKGRWDTIFDAAKTRAEPFTLLDGHRRATPLMHQRAKFSVVERRSVQAIDLPYIGDEVSMVVFLPRSSRGLPRFEAGLTDKELRDWFDALDAAAPGDTILALPKVRLEDRYKLSGTLIKMGAPTAFSSDADFSGMAVEPYPGEEPGATGLEISDVVHQARIDVDEEGAEAAAATITDIDVVAERREGPRPPPIVFRADKPFFFVLRDRRTGLVLFMGRYVAPSGD